MNRRQFTQSAAALGFAPLAPVPVAAAKAAPISAMTMEWARHIARAQNRASPALLMRQLQLSPELAGQVYAKLIAERVVATPGIVGLSKAVSPLPNGLRAPAIAKESSRVMLKAIQDHLEKEGNSIEETLDLEHDTSPQEVDPDTV